LRHLPGSEDGLGAVCLDAEKAVTSDK
jgi:hypothetical protein